MADDEKNMTTMIKYTQAIHRKKIMQIFYVTKLAK